MKIRPPYFCFFLRVNPIAQRAYYRFLHCVTDFCTVVTDFCTVLQIFALFWVMFGINCTRTNQSQPRIIYINVKFLWHNFSFSYNVYVFTLCITTYILPLYTEQQFFRATVYFLAQKDLEKSYNCVCLYYCNDLVDKHGSWFIVKCIITT